MTPRAGAVAAVAAVAITAACGTPLAPPDGLPDSWGAQATASPVPSEQAASELGFSPEQIAAVRIRNDGCESFGTGSGFAIDPHTVVTNRHVVEDYYNLTATMYDGTELTVSESYISTYGDLAVLTIEEELPSVVSLAGENPAITEHIRIIGYPEGNQLTVTEGAIRAIVPDELDDEGFVFSTSAEAKPGSSGSAAYNRDGLVVGVLYAGDDYGTSYIVPVQKLRDLLDKAERQKNNQRACDF